MRVLSRDIYQVLYFEGSTTLEVYVEFAQYIHKHPKVVVESLTPGWFLDDDESDGVYTLTATVSL